jgi:pimeloyl-ACP methyl ester carboxylesterase
MLSYRVEGDGLPLLLIHGFGVSFNIWQNLRPYLSPDFTLIMIELPGIGASPAPEGDYLDACADAMDELREALKIERWRVFSYSSGTRVGERYVQRYAARVVNAIYLCPAQTQFYKALGLKCAKALDARLPSFGDWALSGWRLNFLVRLLGFNLRASPHAQAWTNEIGSRSVHILKEAIRALPRDGLAPIAVPPNVPYLCLWGKRDWITATPRRASARHRLIDATHAAPILEAEQVAELVIPFLSSAT